MGNQSHIADFWECANPWDRRIQARLAMFRSLQYEYSENTAFCGLAAEIDIQKKGYSCQSQGGDKRSA